MVRCKFRVNEIKRQESSEWDGKVSTPAVLTTICMSPVSAKEGEDSIFGKATPTGLINLGIKNQAAAEAFELGKAYYIDISPAE